VACPFSVLHGLWILPLGARILGEYGGAL